MFFFENGLYFPTVDGSDIRRSPVEVGSLSHLYGFIHPRWFSRRISEPSTVSLTYFGYLRKDGSTCWRFAVGDVVYGSPFLMHTPNEDVLCMAARSGILFFLNTRGEEVRPVRGICGNQTVPVSEEVSLMLYLRAVNFW